MKHLHHVVLNPKDLRLNAIAEIMSNPQNYIQDVELLHSKTIEQYCMFMSRDHEFGDDILLHVIVKILKLSVNVYQKQESYHVKSGQIKRAYHLFTVESKCINLYAMEIHLDSVWDMG